MLAYCEHVVGDGQATIATAEAFRRFRAAVVQAADLADLNPEAVLLGATRTAAAEHVPQPPNPPDALRRVARRPATGWCGDVPILLAARANRTISRVDLARLEQHLMGCPACRAPEARFEAAERAYRDPPKTIMPLPATAAIIAALATAAPIRAVVTPAPTMNAPLEPAPVQPPAAPPVAAPPEPPAVPAEPPPAPAFAIQPPPAPEPYVPPPVATEAPETVPAALAASAGPIDLYDGGHTTDYASLEALGVGYEPVESTRSPGRGLRKSLRSLPSVSLPSVSLPSLSRPSLPSISLPKLPSRRSRPAPGRERVSTVPRAQRAFAPTARASSQRTAARLVPAVVVALAVVIAMAFAGVFGGGGDAAKPTSVSPTPTNSSGKDNAPDVIVVPGAGASASDVEAAKARARARARREAQRQSGSSTPATRQPSTSATSRSARPTQQRDTSPPPSPPVDGDAGTGGDEGPPAGTSPLSDPPPAP